MKEKICKKCKISKSIEEFTTAKSTVDKLSITCKLCKYNYDKERRLRLSKDSVYIENCRTTHREGYHKRKDTYVYKRKKEIKHKTSNNYKEKYPEKYKARVKATHLKPIIKNNHLHHWSYNEEHFLNVIEISLKNHYLIHRFIKYDQLFFMYRTLEGELLDTREKHINYISKILNKESQLN